MSKTQNIYLLITYSTQNVDIEDFKSFKIVLDFWCSVSALTSENSPK